MEKTNRIIQALIAEKKRQKSMSKNMPDEYATIHNILYQSYHRIIEEISK